MRVRVAALLLFVVIVVGSCSSNQAWKRDRDSLSQKLKDKTRPPVGATFSRSYSASPGIQLIHFVYILDAIPKFEGPWVEGESKVVPQPGLTCGSCGLVRNLVEGDLVLPERRCTFGVELQSSARENQKYLLDYGFRCDIVGR